MEEPSEKMQEFGTRILRPERRLCNEDLISHELAGATQSDPLGKIRHTAEAVQLLSPPELIRAGISIVEKERALMLHVICLSLQNTYVHQLVDTYGRIIDKWASISWPFPRREARKWLEEWADDLEFTYWQGGPGDAKHEEELSKLTDKFERMYEVTKGQCTMPTLYVFKTRFETYAMPFTALLIQKMLHLVSPSSYEMAMQSLMRGKKKEG